MARRDDQDPNTKAVYAYMKGRIKKNQHILSLIVGKPGSGKSYSAIKLAYDLDPTFTIDRVAFGTEHFLRMLIDDSIKSGSAIIFEEVGANVNARTFYDAVNMAANFAVQTSRYRNLLIFMTAPSGDFVDKSLRKMSNMLFQTLGVNESTNRCHIKPFILIYDSMPGSVYIKGRPSMDIQKRYIRYKLKDKKDMVFKASLMRLKKPPARLINEYERRKKEFHVNLMKDQLYKITGKTGMETVEFTEEEKRVKEYYDKHSDSTTYQCARELGFPANTSVQKILNSIKHKEKIKKDVEGIIGQKT